MPTTDAKPKQFALTLTEDELQMLRELATEARDSSAETVRALVRAAYDKKFKFKLPGAIKMPTLRAILDDIRPAPHFTMGNIAAHTGLPLPVVRRTLETIEKKLPKVLECIDHMKELPGQRAVQEGENWTWELMLMPREKAYAAIERAGFDLDADLSPARQGERSAMGRR